MASTAILRSLRHRRELSSAPISAFRSVLTGNTKPSWAVSNKWAGLVRPFSTKPAGNDVMEGKNPKVFPSQVPSLALLHYQLHQKNQMQFTHLVNSRVPLPAGPLLNSPHLVSRVRAPKSGLQRFLVIERRLCNLLVKQKVQKGIVHLIEHDRREELRKSIEMMLELILRKQGIPYCQNAFLAKVRKLQALLPVAKAEWVQVPSLSQSANLIAQEVALQLGSQKRSLRSIFQQIVQAIPKQAGVTGIRISCSGRLGGAEIARTESAKVGKTSCTGFHHKMDYAFTEVSTRYGILGVKVWISYRK